MKCECPKCVVGRFGEMHALECMCGECLGNPCLLTAPSPAVPQAEAGEVAWVIESGQERPIRHGDIFHDEVYCIKCKRCYLQAELCSHLQAIPAPAAGADAMTELRKRIVGQIEFSESFIKATKQSVLNEEWKKAGLEAALREIDALSRAGQTKEAGDGR